MVMMKKQMPKNKKTNAKQSIITNLFLLMSKDCHEILTNCSED